MAQQFISLSNIDSTVKPGDNFYYFANGKWIRNAVIPPTESGVGSFLDLHEKTEGKLYDILQEVSRSENKAGSIEQKAGDLYFSGMDSAAIEKAGYTPLKPFLQEINSIKDNRGVVKFAGEQQSYLKSFLFEFYVSADEKNSKLNLAVFYQGGLGLPDKDYYFKTDPATSKVVSAYKAYMQKLFALTGDDAATAAKNTEAVFGLEKQMASSHTSNVDLRDPQTNYHKMAVADLVKSMQRFGWHDLMVAMHLSGDSVNVSQPAYFKKLDELMVPALLQTWKLYLRFHLLDKNAPYLSSDFVDANFQYHGKALSGRQQLKPRWKRMISVVDVNLGEALGQLYVNKYFTEEAKSKIKDLVGNLQKAFENRIHYLDWMSDSTKVVATAKLNTFLKKVGYTEKWKDYKTVMPSKNDFFGNLLQCGRFEYNYQVSKNGKPVDRTEWGMTPPTINAYYNPTFNEIVFPAGILQFPFFDPAADDAVNYGGIGMVIGHEMTHGFDDQGAQYDKEGNMKNWWVKDDEAKFRQKGQSVVQLYNSFVTLDTLHLNGKLTLGENMADIGGLTIAYDAFKLTKQGKGNELIDGLTPDQRFFLSFAQIWRSKLKDEYVRQLVNTNPHSPPEFRVLGPLMNFTPFYTAFHVKEGDKMWKPENERIKIW